MNKVLETAIEKKVDPDEFPRDWLIPYRGEVDTCTFLFLDFDAHSRPFIAPF